MNIPIEILLHIFRYVTDDRYRSNDTYLVLYHILRLSPYYQSLCIDYMKMKSITYLKSMTGNLEYLEPDKLYWPNIFKELYYIHCSRNRYSSRIEKYYVLTYDRNHSIVCHVHPFDMYGECDFRSLLCSIMCSAVKTENNCIIQIDDALWDSTSDILNTLYRFTLPRPHIGDEVIIDIELNKSNYRKMNSKNSAILPSMRYRYVFTGDQLSRRKDIIQDLLHIQLRSCVHHDTYTDRFYGEFETFSEDWKDPLYSDYKYALESIA